MPATRAEMNGLERLLCASSMRKGVKRPSKDGRSLNVQWILLLCADKLPLYMIILPEGRIIIIIGILQGQRWKNHV